MNTRYSQIASSEQVNAAVSSIATNIINDTNGQTPLFIALLRGANPFAAKLMIEIVRQQQDYHPEIDYMMIRTYGDAQHAGKPQIITDLAPSTEVKDRNIIIIDDVLDKGITADFVVEELQSRGARTAKLAVLCDKDAQREKSIEADYVGFKMNDNWLVGMGMDDAQLINEGYRWLDEIWEINK